MVFKRFHKLYENYCISNFKNVKTNDVGIVLLSLNITITYNNLITISTYDCRYNSGLAVVQVVDMLAPRVTKRLSDSEFKRGCEINNAKPESRFEFVVLLIIK